VRKRTHSVTIRAGSLSSVQLSKTLKLTENGVLDVGFVFHFSLQLSFEKCLSPMNI
jgi:hypothetical protein